MSRWASPAERLEVEVVLNGEPTVLVGTPRTTLADAIRAHGLTGTHLGCEHGVCGSCTVLFDGRPARSCLVLAGQTHGRRVDTVEALARDGVLNAVQEAFRAHRAQQCGFCTPGFVVLASWLVDNEPDADEARVRDVLSANLCRCTGYAPIVAATLAAIRDTG
jgi:aerobic-type carbon monoxide dehydrogenase small subunit (CoxS/CutS family)